MSAPERRAMVERPGEDLSVRRQCALLNLARSGVYRPGPVDRRRRSGLDAPDRRTASEAGRSTARGGWRSNSTRQAAASTASACRG